MGLACQSIGRDASREFRRIVIGMGKMRAWIAGAIFGLSCVAHADDVLTRVETLLSSGIEPAGAHEQIMALGSAGEDALWTLYGDGAKPRVVRLRALSELARFATVRTAQGFAAIVRQAPSAKDLPASPLVLRRALDGLIAIELSSGIAPSELSYVLHHQDAHVRKAAATLLAKLDGDVDGTLQAIVAHDPSRMVRATAQRARAQRIAR
jgi:hypothetical protein